MINIFRKRFRYNFINATLIIAAVNLAFFLFLRLIPDLSPYLCMNPVLVIRGKMYWQLVTCMFVHGNFKHLFFNMLGLIMFGISVEKSIGSKEFTLLYFVCGILANVFSLLIYVLSGQTYIMLMGASGAVYSILFAFAVIYPTVRVFIFGIIPVPGPILILIYTIVEIFSQFFGFNLGIAHMTHLFGFAAAWAYFVIRMGVNPIKIWKNALRH